MRKSVRRFFYCGVTTLALAFFLSTVHGQSNRTVPQNLPAPGNAPGTAAGSYALSGFESVNPFSGKVNFSLPLIKIGGRGNAGYGMNLNIQRNWHITHQINDPNIYSSPSAERYVISHSYLISEDSPTDGYIADFSAGIMRGRRVGTNRSYISCGTASCYDEVLTRLFFVQGDGSELEFRDVTKGGKATAPNYNNLSRGTHWVSVDGSNATFISSDVIYDQTYRDEFADTFYPSGTLYLANGTKYTIQNGRVTHIKDINGNTVIPDKDSLGREVNFTFNLDPATQTVIDRIINFKGTNGAARTIKISHSHLSNRLSAGYQLTSIYNLFPGVPVPVGYGGMYDPGVISLVELPDGRKYEFRYNSYGELSEITLPTGGKIEYVWQTQASVYGTFEEPEVMPHMGAPPPDDKPNPQIRHRVQKRRVYEGGELKTETVYGFPEEVSGNANVTVYNYAKENGNLVLVNKSKHYYYGSPIPPYNGQLPTHPTDDPGMLEGKEYKTEIYDAANVLLRRTEIAWEAGTPLAANPAANINARVAETKETLADSNQVSKKTFSYDSFNNQTDVYEYDFGSGQPSNTLLRRTHTDYVTDTNYTAYTGAHLRSLPLQTWISSDAAGTNRAAFSEFEYDNYTTDANHAALTARSSVVGHDAVNYGASHTRRGNVTKTTAYANAQSQTETVNAYSQYDVLGNVVKTIDGRGNAATIDYADRFGAPDAEARENNIVNLPELAGQSTFAFATSATNALGWTTYAQFDYHTGQTVNAEDVNGVIGKTIYNDSLDRPTQSVAAVGTIHQQQSSIIYDDANRRVETRSDFAVFNDNAIKAESFYDELGRTVKTIKHETGGTTVVSETKYDALGRAHKTSNPYRPTEVTTQNPILWRTRRFDALGRVTEVETPDGAKVKTNYHGTRTLVTDQANKQRISRTNALGQLEKVWEVALAADSATIAVSFPNSTPTVQQGYETSYEYDTLSNLQKVIQGGQTRTFNYDSLSRLKQATNPESGAINYSYDAGGNLLTKTDARSIVTTYTYDTLSRVQTRAYTNEPTGHATPTVTYTYDQSEVAHSKGKLTRVSSAVSETSYTGFDAMGKLLASQQATDGQTYNFAYGYNLSGALTSQTYPSGRIVKNEFDVDGDLARVTAQKNTNTGAKLTASSFSYTAAGAVSSMRLGNGRWESTVFNSRLQPRELGLGSSAANTSLWKVKFDYGTTDNNGNIKSQEINVPDTGASNGFKAVQTYNYDSLNRLKSAVEDVTVNGQTTSQQTWKQTYTFDRFGNRRFDMADTTTPNAQGNLPKVINPEISAVNNRFVADQDGDSQADYVYDAAGNLTKDATGQQFIYDGENKQKEVKNSSSQIVGIYFYDGDGKRVKKIAGAETTIFVYDASGRLAAEYSTQTPPAQATTSYLTNDHLGSPRVITNAQGNVTSRRDFLPFGEDVGTSQRTAALGYQPDNIRQGFTGYLDDDESGLDYAQNRYYNQNHGRFTSVDPIMSSGRPIIPKSWNRYVYVLNNPLRYVDPDGLQDCETNKPCKEIPPPPKIKVTFIDNKTGKQVPITKTTQKIIDNLVKKNWSIIYNTALNTEARGNLPDSEVTEKNSEKSKSDTLKGDISADGGVGGESNNASKDGVKSTTVKSLEDKLNDQKSYINNNAIAESAFERTGTTNANEAVQIINGQLRQEAVKLTEGGNASPRLPDEQFKKNKMQQHQNRPPRFGPFPNKYD